MNRLPAKRANDGSTPEPKRPKKTTTTSTTPSQPSTAKTATPPTTKKDEPKLNPEIELQRSLLRSSPSLSQRFAEALRERPPDITQKALARQFWTQRAHLLRAHAIELEQKKAAYNVFSQVQPRHSEGVTKLNITPEQVEDIFRQHPVVRRAYNDSVPGRFKNDMAFWSAFFVSRLFKRLKGERIMESDATDPVLDKYLNAPNTSTPASDTTTDETAQGRKVAEQHVPHFIDLSGNEAHHSQKLGNRPDFLMRPSRSDKVPILHILNNMSEKIMAHVAPADADPHAPIGMDEETYNELRIRDLQAEEGEDRMVLKIRQGDTQRGKSDLDKDKPSEEAIKYAKQDPRATLSTLSTDLSAALDASTHELDLTASTGFPRDDAEDDEEEDSASEDEEQLPTATTPNTRPIQQIQNTALKTAHTHIQSLISQHLPPSTSTTALILPSPLDADTTTNLILTLHTTNEFLHYFWNAFLALPKPSPSISGPSSQTQIQPTQSQTLELTSLHTTLQKSLVRITSAAQSAETAKQERITKLKKEAAEKQVRLAHKRKVHWSEMGSAGAGGDEVGWLMGGAVGALGVAGGVFEGVFGTAAA